MVVFTPMKTVPDNTQTVLETTISSGLEYSSVIQVQDTVFTLFKQTDSVVKYTQIRAREPDVKASLHYLDCC